MAQTTRKSSSGKWRVSGGELRVRSGGDGGVIGLKGKSTAAVIEKINAGFAIDHFDNFVKATGLELEVAAEIVQIPARTLSRRRADGRLRPDESERLLRVSTIFEKAVDLFDGDNQAAMQWLQTPQPALGGVPPLEFIRTEIGAREVEDLIGRLEHGVFT